jgi:peptide/nickel transport system substrate-binding protein
MKRPRRITLVSSVAVVLLGAIALATTAASGGSVRQAAGHPCVVATGSGDAAFIRNFNPFQAGAQVSRDFTAGGIYENLVISTVFGGGNVYNVLAKKFTWSNGGKLLTIAIQPNVKWSDGSKLTAADVAYSLNIGHQSAFADRIGLLGATSNIVSIKVAGKNKVAVRFKAVDSTFIGSQLPNAWIVPKKIWSKVDVEKFTNPNPVGTGPFTKITRFNAQDYVLSKNPNYWQKGEPKVNCIERIAASSNDAALLQQLNGQADWAHNFVPNVESAFQAKDPKHFFNSYLVANLPFGIYFDTTEYPYSLVAFRKALSRAIDRKTISKLGEYGYAPPTSALGIDFVYPKWIDPKLKARAKEMANYDPDAAKKILTGAGFTYKGGNLYDPKGDRVSFTFHAIGGWSDWVASLQIVQRNLRAVGMDMNVKLEPDWGAWQPGAMSTKFPSFLWNYGGQDVTPYAYFFSHFDPSQNVGKGNDASATGNWEHFQSAQGAALLKQFKSTLDQKKQMKIAYQLEKIFLDDLPYVPWAVNPRWSTYSTRYFTGFPTWNNQYVDPIFTTWQQVEKILLSLRPVSST